MPCSLSPASRRTSSNSPARRARKIGEELSLIDKDRFELCWIVDFPMYEWNEEEKKIDFSHNPFSMPNLPAEEFLALDAGDNDKILGAQGDPIRHRLQRRGTCRPAPSAIIAPT